MYEVLSVPEHLLPNSFKLWLWRNMTAIRLMIANNWNTLSYVRLNCFISGWVENCFVGTEWILLLISLQPQPPAVSPILLVPIDKTLWAPLLSWHCPLKSNNTPRICFSTSYSSHRYVRSQFMMISTRLWEGEVKPPSVRRDAAKHVGKYWNSTWHP